ncbi:MAG: hypothetical protein HY026_08260 [Deltaproteobacteria bacterium]|nr:hypothetical protein [Deltaproteobacteria bacterium]
MRVDFPIDERSLRYVESMEDDPDIKAIISILLDKQKEDFYNYASIICFCYREEDLINLPDIKHLPHKVKAWIKRKSFDRDPTYFTFFKHLFSLYSGFVQTYEGWDKLGKHRSVIPEAYIYHRTKERYASKPAVKVERECFVVIDGWDSRIHRSKEVGQKVDIGVWDDAAQHGEVYEVKVKMYIKEKEHQLEFIETIRKVSSRRIDVFLASFAPKHVVLHHLRTFFPGRNLDQINVLGVDELQNL